MVSEPAVFEQIPTKHAVVVNVLPETSESWSHRSRWHNELHAAIERETQGRIRDLMVGWEDQMSIVEARCDAYYAVQLSLCAARAFLDQSQAKPPVRLTFDVRGHWLELFIVSAAEAVETERIEPPELVFARS
ncbi:hypothetical protein CA13_68670 [Planctomycetes bacterium CA13]|uniref:Uncharacterized protein n=1 Tax=Novipirellula herctigrandis TaxID=2527986 RepID=A0A5C5YNA8_9BACT|nr:hypothetical protein CA13_68670 [Planctomycetes bacterium CA13]